MGVLKLYCDPANPDMRSGHAAHAHIEALVVEGIATGCGGGKFCPDQVVTRDLTARWLLMAANGSDYTPPSASGAVFEDVAGTDFAADWIEDLVTHQATEGCNITGNRYCPHASLSKVQAAMMLLKARHGLGYAPAAAVSAPYDDVDIGEAGVYGDGDFASDWIVALHDQGYAEGCNANRYCPRDALTKAGFAKLVAKVFDLVP